MKIMPKFELSYSFLKWSAILWMTYDHVLKTLLNVDENAWVLFPGRLAFPLFAFIIACNLAEKKIFAKYLVRLLPFALVSFAVDYFCYDKIELNILFTFMFSISIIWAIEKCGEIKNKFIRWGIVAYIVVLSLMLGSFFEFRLLGVWLVPLFYAFMKARSVVYYIISILVLILIMPNWDFGWPIAMFGAWMLLIKPKRAEKRSSFKKTGWMFYAYYPFHKWVIAVVKQLSNI